MFSVTLNIFTILEQYFKTVIYVLNTATLVFNVIKEKNIITTALGVKANL